MADGKAPVFSGPDSGEADAPRLDAERGDGAIRPHAADLVRSGLVEDEALSAEPLQPYLPSFAPDDEPISIVGDR